jgi:hypothetical protein
MRSGSDQRPRGRYNGSRPFRQPQQQPQRNQALQSNGPDVKIRGSAYQIFERYIALAREAAIGGDPVAAENLYQHAEHYLRVNKESRDGIPQAPRSTAPGDVEMSGSYEPALGEIGTDNPQPRWEDERPRSDAHDG